jgi:hypothetical protein
MEIGRMEDKGHFLLPKRGWRAIFIAERRIRGSFLCLKEEKGRNFCPPLLFPKWGENHCSGDRKNVLGFSLDYAFL